LNLKRKKGWVLLGLLKEKKESVNTAVTRLQDRGDEQERREQSKATHILGILNQEMTFKKMITTPWKFFHMFIGVPFPYSLSRSSQHPFHVSK